VTVRAFLYPGQGSQSVGMAADLFREDEHFRSLIAHAEALVGRRRSPTERGRLGRRRAEIARRRQRCTGAAHVRRRGRGFGDAAMTYPLIHG